jgi:hypothetical protein
LFALDFFDGSGVLFDQNTGGVVKATNGWVTPSHVPAGAVGAAGVAAPGASGGAECGAG